MLRKSNGSIHWLEFELLSGFKELRHGVFLRQGGVSKQEYSSLNLADHVGDNLVDVRNNQSLIKSGLGIQELYWGKQCHGKEILEVKSASSPIFEADALMTNRSNIGLMIMHADCQAAIFYDPIHHAAANVHSGWRGNVQNIYQATIEAMQSKYGTSPQDLIVCISPSLGPESAEFLNYKIELPEHFWQYQLKPFYFDFWEISRSQLVKSGVLSHHIQIAEIDTFSNRQDFFSYRRDKVTGRNGTVIILK